MSLEPKATLAERDEESGGLLYPGYSGNLVLTGRSVVIRRGFKGFATQGALRGTKEIPYESIVATQFKKNGMTPGWLQLSIRGGSEAKGGLYQAEYDENTVTFWTRSTCDRFAEARDLINARAEAARDRASTGEGTAPVDAIRELASLHEQGVLTDDQFESGKAKLLEQL